MMWGPVSLDEHEAVVRDAELRLETKVARMCAGPNGEPARYLAVARNIIHAVREHKAPTREAHTQSPWQSL